jgi:hypothetical protein
LKSVGAQGHLITPNALDEPRLWHEIGFPRRGRPKVGPGDRLVLYGTAYKRAFAVVEVTTDPFLSDEVAEQRWPWRVRVRPLLIVPEVRNGARLEDGGVRSASMKQRSHLVLTDEQYDGFVTGLTRLARAA